jgi:hypothetical protein
MAEPKLTLRDLNRATLSRQMLLERESTSLPQAIERLVGLQAQSAIAPYIGLWTRLPDFRREALSELIEKRTIIKATLMRATLHLCTAEDFLLLRGALQPVLTSAFESILKNRDKGLGFDLVNLLTMARKFIDEEPRSFAEITAMFEETVPEGDVGAQRYAVRTHVPLVQVPNNSTWSFPGNPKFTLAESWLGRAIPDEDNLRLLILRYLAAFGPATVADIQTWSGLGKLKEFVATLKPELAVYKDEKGHELFDLPNLSLPAADTPAPVRFLPEYDNLLLSHKDRKRIIADEYRSKVYLPGLRVRSTFLVDGFVAGGWKAEKAKGMATLVIEPFESLTKQTQKALAEEAERLIRFIEADAKSLDVRFSAEE